MKRVASAIVPVIAIHRESRDTLHRQIYDAYRRAIVDGSLRPAQRIPSTRVLASELRVSRFPVLSAYAQLLAEGYFESRVGAGTVVSHSIPDQLTSSGHRHAQFAAQRSAPRPFARRCSTLPRFEGRPWQLSGGAFVVGQIAYPQFPLQVWSSLVARHCRNMNAKSFHYPDQIGSAKLRETIASYLRTARSLRCEAEQVMIVSGSQQALEMCALVLLDAGSRVWVEEPGYRLARDVFALVGARSVPVPVDMEGMDVAAGIRQARQARAVLVTPSHQFPLGVTMSATRRLQLLEWAQHSGAWIIEDDYDSEFRYEGMPIASLQGLDANACVIYIGTFSKVLFPSLRLGYVVIPPDLVDRFKAVRRVMDLGPPAFFQEVLAEFIEQGHFARHIRRMRMLYGERASVLLDTLHSMLGGMVEVFGGEAGMHLAVMLKKRCCDQEIAGRAAQQNLWLWPLSPSYLSDGARQGFILGFGSTQKEDIPTAVAKFRNLLV